LTQRSCRTKNKEPPTAAVKEEVKKVPEVISLEIDSVKQIPTTKRPYKRRVKSVEIPLLSNEKLINPIMTKAAVNTSTSKLSAAKKKRDSASSINTDEEPSYFEDENNDFEPFQSESITPEPNSTGLQNKRSKLILDATVGQENSINNTSNKSASSNKSINPDSFKTDVHNTIKTKNDNNNDSNNNNNNNN